MNKKEMMKEVEQIDFSAVISRLVGKPLSEEEKEMCERYDNLYDELRKQEAAKQA